MLQYNILISLQDGFHRTEFQSEDPELVETYAWDILEHGLKIEELNETRFYAPNQIRSIVVKPNEVL